MKESEKKSLFEEDNLKKQGHGEACGEEETLPLHTSVFFCDILAASGVFAVLVCVGQTTVVTAGTSFSLIITISECDQLKE